MSARAMILTAAMAILLAARMIPGEAPEKASREIEQVSQPLDLSGDWVFTCAYGKVTLKGEDFIGSWDLKDEGDGKLSMSYWTEPGFAFAEHSSTRGSDTISVCGPFTFVSGVSTAIRHTMLGIYRQDGDRVLMCFGEHDKKRPTSFHTKDGQFLITLHRVKSSK